VYCGGIGSASRCGCCGLVTYRNLSAERGECLIGLGPLSLAEAVTLPCGHMFHPACVKGLRAFGL
jgi:hypothetical protein